ncbi:MAG: RNA polymerase sigma factor [Gemmatimonadaceae bacterium]
MTPERGAPPTHDLDTDRRLATAFLAGDEGAFRALYRRHTPRLRNVVRRLVGDASGDADDVVQESWVRAAGGLRVFRWESSFSTWLIGIGVRVASGVLRRRARWHTVELAGSLQSCSPMLPEADIDLERAITLLPERLRAVLVLHDVEGFTHVEIGEQLGFPTGSSKAYLSRARHEIRRTLRQLPEQVNEIR